MGKEAAKTKEEMQAIARKNEAARLRRVSAGSRYYPGIRSGAGGSSGLLSRFHFLPDPRDCRISSLSLEKQTRTP